MELTAFPPADAFIQQLLKIEYKKHFNNLITIALTIAAIAHLMFEKFQTMKFKTPDFITDYFYFSVNMIAPKGDEIVGLSIGNRYIGIYNDSIVWGILNENGAL